MDQLQPNDAVLWQHRFLALAERTQGLAEDMQKHGRLAAARNSYLGASNYFRCAQYMYPNMAVSDTFCRHYGIFSTIDVDLDKESRTICFLECVIGHSVLSELATLLDLMRCVLT